MKLRYFAGLTFEETAHVGDFGDNRQAALDLCTGLAVREDGRCVNYRNFPRSGLLRDDFSHYLEKLRVGACSRISTTGG